MTQAAQLRRFLHARPNEFAALLPGRTRVLSWGANSVPVPTGNCKSAVLSSPFLRPVASSVVFLGFRSDSVRTSYKQRWSSDEPYPRSPYGPRQKQSSPQLNEQKAQTDPGPHQRLECHSALKSGGLGLVTALLQLLTSLPVRVCMTLRKGLLLPLIYKTKPFQQLHQNPETYAVQIMKGRMDGLKYHKVSTLAPRPLCRLPLCSLLRAGKQHPTRRG